MGFPRKKKSFNLWVIASQTSDITERNRALGARLMRGGLTYFSHSTEHDFHDFHLVEMHNKLNKNASSLFRGLSLVIC